jgi:hypothetical protein
VLRVCRPVPCADWTKQTVLDLRCYSSLGILTFAFAFHRLGQQPDSLAWANLALPHAGRSHLGKPPKGNLTIKQELNAPQVPELVSVCHIGLWNLKMHFWPPKLVMWCTAGPWTLKMYFLPLNLSRGAPQAPEQQHVRWHSSMHVGQVASSRLAATSPKCLSTHLSL